MERRFGLAGYAFWLELTKQSMTPSMTVLSTTVAKAVQLSTTEAGAIYVFSKLRQKFACGPPTA